MARDPAQVFNTVMELRLLKALICALLSVPVSHISLTSRKERSEVAFGEPPQFYAMAEKMQAKPQATAEIAGLGASGVNVL